MKKIILATVAVLMAFAADAQTRFGFAQQGYDNWNVQDANAACLLLVWPDKNEPLQFVVGADVFAIDGSAKNGTDFNFPTTKWVFPVGTNIFDSSNRKKLPYNFTINSTFWGKKDFIIRLEGLQGVAADGLINGQQEMRVVIDYDGSGVGLPRLSFHDYRLYPVPAQSTLWIEGANPDQFKIYDLSGRLAMEGGLMQNSIDVSNLGYGLYVLYAQTEKGMIVQKFLKN